MPGPTTDSSTHQRTTCATSSIGSPMKGSSSTGAHPGSIERGKNFGHVLFFSTRVRPLPTCAGNGGGFTADCPKCKYHTALSYSRVNLLVRSFTKALDKREVEENDNVDGEDDEVEREADEEGGEGDGDEDSVEDHGLDLELTLPTCKLTQCCPWAALRVRPFC